MQVSNFIKYIETPQAIDAASKSDVELLVKEFPYCQTGQMMLAIQLNGSNSILFDHQLKKTAAYCTDRNQLFVQLHPKEKVESIVEVKVKPELPKNEPEITAFKQEVKVVEKTIVEDVKPKGKEVDKELNSLEKQYLSAAISSTILLEVENEETVSQKPPAKVSPQQLPDFDEGKGHSFISWLKHYNEDEKETKVEVVLENRIVKQDLIDKFIQEDPKIQPKKTEFYSPTNMARLSVVDESDIVSETLALIYVDQGDYRQAISAYKKLSLKNPEKRSYFANQIKVLNQKLK